MSAEHWLMSRSTLLRDHQTVYTFSPYRSLAELVFNSSRRNVLVIAAHQDDEVIGMGGTMKLYAEGVRYPNGPYEDMDPKTFAFGGLKLFPESVVADVQRSLAEGGINLRLLPEDPNNVIALYVTNGAKTEKTIQDDIQAAHPARPLNQHFERFNVTNLDDLSACLNQLRYPETLAALEYVGAKAAIFLDYSSSEIKTNLEERKKASEDLTCLLEFLKPEVVYTLSPFDTSHPTHLFTSSITVQAVRQLLERGYKPQLRGYPVWDPDKRLHREIVDISVALGDKLDAIHRHSMLGSQGAFGREYERVVELNAFNAVMQRPRLPVGISAVEIFVDMDRLLVDQSMDLKEFAKRHFEQIVEQYPVGV